MRLFYLTLMGIVSWASLAAGNFLFQAMHDKIYWIAAERSYFQLVAILVFLVQMRLWKGLLPEE